MRAHIISVPLLLGLATSSAANAQANALENCGNSVLICASSNHFANIVAAAQAGNIGEVDRIARTCKCSRGNTMSKGDKVPVGLGCYATKLTTGGWMIWGGPSRPGVCP